MARCSQSVWERKTIKKDETYFLFHRQGLITLLHINFLMIKAIVYVPSHNTRKLKIDFPHLCLAPCVIVSGEQSLEQAHCPAASHLSEKLNTSTPALLFVTQGHGQHLQIQNRHPAPMTSPCGFSARNTGLACEVCGHAQWREGPEQLRAAKKHHIGRIEYARNRHNLVNEIGIGNHGQWPPLRELQQDEKN